jgi:hypothetical protein
VIRRPQQCFPSQIAAKEAPMTAVEDLVDRNKLRSGTGDLAEVALSQP